MDSHVAMWSSALFFLESPSCELGLLVMGPYTVKIQAVVPVGEDFCSRVDRG